MAEQAVNQRVLEQTARRCAERGVIIPTFAQLADPQKIPPPIRQRLSRTGMNDLDPVNLFRINGQVERLPCIVQLK